MHFPIYPNLDKSQRASDEANDRRSVTEKARFSRIVAEASREASKLIERGRTKKK